MSKDYYAVLGADKNATADELKKLYRQKSKQYHPDMQTGKSEAEKKAAEEKFKEVAEAYSVLGDKEKREHYDKYGDAGDNAGGFPGFGGGFDPFEMFEHMAGHGRFGGFGGRFGGFNFGMDGTDGGAAPDWDRAENGKDVETSISVSFKESVNGCIREFDLDLDKECPDCHGRGIKNGSNPKKCQHCNGTGQVVSTQRNGFMVYRQVTECGHCGGTGYEFEKCPKCNGRKRVADTRHVKVKVPAGVRTGMSLRLSGLGQCGVKHGQNGNLYISVSVERSELFERLSGNDVETHVFISPVTAVLGGEIRVPTPYEFKTMAVSPNTKSGTRQRVNGAGIRTDKGAGDLYVKIEIEPYIALTAEQRELLEKLKSTETSKNRPLCERMMSQADAFYKK